MSKNRNGENQAAAAVEQKKPEVAAVPAAKITNAEQFQPVNGKFPKLKRVDFAKDNTGTSLWFSFLLLRLDTQHAANRARLEKHRAKALASKDPKEKIRQQIAAMQAKLAALGA